MCVGGESHFRIHDYMSVATEIPGWKISRKWFWGGTEDGMAAGRSKLIFFLHRKVLDTGIAGFPHIKTV